MQLTEEQYKQLRSLLSNVKTIDDLMGKDGVITQLTATAINALLEAERDAHMGYPPHAVEGKDNGNRRNGYSKKTV